MKTTQGKTFIKKRILKWEKVEEGITRQFLGFNMQLMMVKVKFQKGAVGYLHHHFQSQATYVASGKFEITIDGQSELLGVGDGFFVQPNLRHGAKCLEEGMLVEVFSPVREEFLKYISE